MADHLVECPDCEDGRVLVESGPPWAPRDGYVNCERCDGSTLIECRAELCSVCAQVAEDLESREVPFVVTE